MSIIKYILILTLLMNFTTITGQSLNEIFTKGNTAYEANNYVEYLEAMVQIDSIRPNYPIVVYNLAIGYALNNQPFESIATMRRLLLMDNSYDIEANADLAVLKSHPEFASLIQLKRTMSNVISCPIHAEFPFQSEHPESITYHKPTKTFLFGMVNSGTIRMSMNDQATWNNSTQNSWAVMGLDFDRKFKKMWVCTAAMTEYASLDEDDQGKSSVIMYDFKKKSKRNEYVMEGQHVFGDIIVASNGLPYISDGVENTIYTIKNDSIVPVFEGPPGILNIQGITLGAREDFLFFSDYITGIYKLSFADKTLKKIKTPSSITAKGIDGLYYYQDQLIAIHNGTNPKRVMRYFLDTENEEIITQEIIAQGGDNLNEPTQGIIIGDTFYFIANSPWASYVEGTLTVPTNATSIVMEYDLKK